MEILTFQASKGWWLGSLDVNVSPVFLHTRFWHLFSLLCGLIHLTSDFLFNILSLLLEDKKTPEITVIYLEISFTGNRVIQNDLFQALNGIILATHVLNFFTGAIGSSWI